MADVNLSKAVRSNLLSLQSTASSMAKTQERLATGLKVNSALDNPTNFFTASSRNSRASDMASLLDSMSNGIKTIEAADNGLSSITKTVESMQSTLRQARQDKSFKTQSYSIDATTIGTTASKTISFEDGAVGGTAVSVNLNTTGAGSAATAGTFTSTANFAAVTFTDTTDAISFDIAVDGGTATSVSITGADVALVGDNDGVLDDAAELNSLLTAKGVTGVTASVNGGGKLVLTSATTGTGSSVAVTNFAETDVDTDTTITGIGLDGGTSATGAALVPAGAVKTVDALVQEINTNTSLKDKIRASNDNAKLRIENLSTQELNVDGVSSTGVIDGASTGASEIGGNTVRADLALQFNELRDQLDKLSDDASFNGINLLRGDNLKITFNETGTSDIDIQTKDGEPLNSANLSIFDISAIDLDSDTNIDTQLANLKTALSDVRSQSSAFGSNLSIVQNRQDFTKEMINTLETGGANLTLAE